MLKSEQQKSTQSMLALEPFLGPQPRCRCCCSAAAALRLRQTWLASFRSGQHLGLWVADIWLGVCIESVRVL